MVFYSGCDLAGEVSSGEALAGFAVGKAVAQVAHQLGFLRRHGAGLRFQSCESVAVDFVWGARGRHNAPWPGVAWLDRI